MLFASAKSTDFTRAKAALKLIDELKVVENVADVGPYMMQGLRDRLGQHPHVGDIRGQGLMLGIELMQDRETKQILPPENRTGRQVLKAAAQRGLITRALGDTLVFAPPLVLTRAEADEIVDKFALAVDDVLKA